MLSRQSQQLAFPVVLFLTLVAALVPAEWQPRWIGELGEFLRFPLRPFTEGGTALAGWLRPEPRVALARGETDFAALERELERARRLYHAEHQRVLDLETQLEGILAVPRETLAQASLLVTGYVTSRTPGEVQGAVEVRPETSFRGAVHANTIAVRHGVHLLGRTIDGGGTTTCLVLPLAHTSTGAMQTAVFPADRPTRPLEEAVRVHLEPTGRGGFRGDVHRGDDVHVGDTVRLNDHGWPGTAQLMIVGTVVDIQPKDSEPLRSTITVEPRYDLAQITELTLILMEGLASAENTP